MNKLYGEGEVPFYSNPFMQHNSIEVEERAKDHVIVKAKIAPEHLNLHGYVHGGLLFTLSDCAAGSMAQSDGRIYVTQTANNNFIGNVKEGTVYARSEVISRKKRISVIHVVVYQDDNILMDSTFNMYCVSAT
jgi:acyl-CoA thioesterase